MKDPLVSIIVPVYKVESWLPACIDSVLRQTYQNWELILIDDGSPDDCGRICDEYAAKEKRIRVLHKENAGVSAARNDGLACMKGTYVTFLDSDDEFELDNTLADNIQLLESCPQIDILQYPVRSSNQAAIPQVEECVLSNRKDLLKAMVAFTINGYLWSKIYRSSLFKEVRLPQGITFAEDTWCLLDLVPKVNQFYLSNRGAYLYNVRGDSAVHSFDKKKCLDLFLMSHKFIHVLAEYIPASDDLRVAYFFLTFQRLLDARIANKDAFDYKRYESDIKQSIPSLSNLFKSTLAVKHKAWLILLRLFGISFISDRYVRFVLRRISKTSA